jgi:hypothetical protein
MKEPNAHIIIEGHGRKPSTPRPLPTFAQPGRIVGAETTRGAGERPSPPKPASPLGGKDR